MSSDCNGRGCNLLDLAYIHTYGKGVISHLLLKSRN